MLKSIFEELLFDKIKYVNCQKGKEFEENVKNLILDFGYIPSPLSKEQKADIKNIVCDKSKIDYIENKYDIKQCFAFQPFGTQSYPDFLVFEKEKIFLLDTKLITGSRSTPMWNSGLPRQNAIYIFGTAQKNKKDLTFFRGCDLLTPEEYNKLWSFFEDSVENANKFNNDEMKKQKYGFSVYARKAFTQKKFDENTITNFFKNPERVDLEKAVLFDLEE